MGCLVSLVFRFTNFIWLNAADWIEPVADFFPVTFTFTWQWFVWAAVSPL